MASKRGLIIEQDNRSRFSGLYTLRLPQVLRDFYGSDLDFVADPLNVAMPLVYINFVMSVEGIFNLRNNPGGGPISRRNFADAFGMLLLRAAADAVMIGVKTVNEEDTHIWDTDYIFQYFPQMRGQTEFQDAINAFRTSLGKKTKKPITFIVTNSGHVNFGASVFQPDSGVTTYVVTGERGRERIAKDHPGYAHVLAFGEDALDEEAMLKYLKKEMGINLLLHEGGRSVVESLIKQGFVDQFFLTHMATQPDGDLDPANVQYLFEHNGHMPPRTADIITSRRDSAGNAHLFSFDYRTSREM